ncbi:MAG: tetrathionate reductase family octaheme c-type cytochrome [Candidatus Marinimicrobia bacterium]|nr:tetrathionate reductase family octaheme c-type cytochrome [Candidatus Neomarinimicrobiota bacterium]
MIIIPILVAIPGKTPPVDDPHSKLSVVNPHVDHSSLMNDSLTTGQEVTRACLVCHPDAGNQVRHTSHYTWESDSVYSPDHDRMVTLGKKNAINNFCISIESNWPACTACHAGYGWKDAEYDFSKDENVDCLVCHDLSGGYKKSKEGLPEKGVDLLAAAKSVGSPNRENCGGCHFDGGGGNAVKHGDLDESLKYPSEYIDVHMGRYDFQCITCHRSTDHKIRGRASSVSVGNLNKDNQVLCTDCHAEKPHSDMRLNEHTETVACQTCHIPSMARKEATKINWDWSTAGQDRPENAHQYLKIKGSFVYEKNHAPEYIWYNGTTKRYLKGDIMDPTITTPFNLPNGNIKDREAKIWPFKVHYGKQVYDTKYNYFLLPKTVGEGGFWTEFDWDLALRLGAENSGLAYSGKYNFAPTSFYWATSHMVAPKEEALRCIDCHSDAGRLDWQQLGFDGDPITHGSRRLAGGVK